MEGFAAASLHAADEALTPSAALVRPPARSLDSVLGIFKDEPLMDALMARIHAERQAQMEQEMEAQETGAVFTVVTCNGKDFSAILGVVWEDWSRE